MPEQVGIRPVAGTGPAVEEAGLREQERPGAHRGHDDDPALGKALADYGRAKLDRLVSLKRRYDPENLFRINHNIPPDA